MQVNKMQQQARLQSATRSTVRPSLCRRSALVCKAQKDSPSLAQRASAFGAAALMALSTLSGSAIASVPGAIETEFDLLFENKPSTYYVDNASVLSSSTKGGLDKTLKDLEDRTGYRLEVVTVPRLEFQTDGFPDPAAFSEKLLESWYSVEEADKKGIVLVVTAGKEGAIVGGASFLDAVGDDLLDNIVDDQIPNITGQEKYNLTVESVVQRITAKLKGESVPEAPARPDNDNNTPRFSFIPQGNKSKNA